MTTPELLDVPLPARLDALRTAAAEAADGRAAAALLEQVLGLCAQHYGAESDEAACAASDLGDAYTALGQYEDAQAWYERARHHFEADPASPDVANMLNKLGETFIRRGTPEEAIERFARAEAIMTALLAPFRADVAGGDLAPQSTPEAAAVPPEADLIFVQAVVGHGEALRLCGHYARAEALQRRAVRLAATRFGPDHPARAEALTSLGANLKYQARYDEAEANYRAAYAILRAAHGEAHVALAPVLYNIGGAYHGRGQYAEGVPYVRRALALHEAHHGPDHPVTALYATQLAALLEGTGAAEEAEALYRRAVALLERHFGRTHRDVAMNLNNLGALALARGDAAEAEQLYREALTIKEAVLGPEHPDVGTTLANLGFLYRQQGRGAAAAVYFLTQNF